MRDFEELMRGQAIKRGFNLGLIAGGICALVLGADLGGVRGVASAAGPPQTATTIPLTVTPWFQFAGVTTVAAGSPYIIKSASCANPGVDCFAMGETVNLTIPLPAQFVWSGQAQATIPAAIASTHGDISATVRTDAAIRPGTYNVFASGGTSGLVGVGSVTFTASPPSVTSQPGSVIAGGNTSLIATGFDPGVPGGSGEQVCINDAQFISSVTVQHCGTADGSGKVTLPFSTLPTDPAGSYSEVLQGSVSGRTASTSVGVRSPVPSVSVSPTSGAPGTTFVATAAGFTPSETLTFMFGTLKLTQTADSSGKAAFTSALDCRTPAGTYTAAVTGSSSGRQGSGTYTQKASAAAITLTPASVSTLAASTVTVSGSGFTPNEIVDLAGAGLASTTTTTADATGAFSGATAVTIDASTNTLDKGSYTVTAVGETSFCRVSKSFSVTSTVFGTSSPTNPIPQVTILPSSLTFGQGFVVSMSNLLVGSPVTFSISGVTLNSTTVTADSSGTATFSGLFDTVFPNGAFSVLGTSGSTTAAARVSIGRAVAALSLSPTNPSPGEAVTISGSGFESGEPVNVFFNNGGVTAPTPTPTAVTSVNSNLRTPGSFGRAAAGKNALTLLGKPVATAIAKPGVRSPARSRLSAIPSSSGVAPRIAAASLTSTVTPGTFSVPVNVPFTVSGNVQVQAIGTVSGQMASAVLAVSRPTATLSSLSGAPGDSITVSGSGFAPSESLTVSLFTGDSGISPNPATDPLGGFNVSASVPPIAAGTYSMLVTGSTSGFTANAPLTVFQTVTATPSPTATGIPLPTATPVPSGGGGGGGGGAGACGACGGAGSTVQPANGGGPASVTEIPNGGGTANDGQVTVYVPSAALTGAAGGTLNVQIQSNPANVPIPGGPARYSPNGTIRDITITDASGNLVTTFPVPISLTLHYNAADLAMANGDPHLLTAAYVIDHNSPAIENPMHFPDGTFVIFPPQDVTLDLAGGNILVQTQALGSVITVITNPVGYVQSLVPTQLLSSFDPTHSQVFGTVGQFKYLQVVEPQIGTRLLVMDPDTQNVAYVDATSVGPSGPPPGH